MAKIIPRKEKKILEWFGNKLTKNIFLYSCCIICSRLGIQEYKNSDASHPTEWCNRDPDNTGVGEDVERMEPSIHCWWVKKMLQSLWKKKNLTVLQKAKHRVVLSPRSSTLTWLETYVYMNLYKNAPSSNISCSQKGEITQTTINRWRGEQNVVWIYT